MDFDTAKENIQPLRQGRRPDALEMALNAQSKESLENEKRQRLEAIAEYEGEDPLSVHYDYICWIEQNYPKGGSESGLDKAVLECICAFDSEEFPQFMKYRQDRRMIKLYIKYIDSSEDPHVCYRKLYEKGIGTLVADLYIAWSHYYEALNNFKEVEAIFLKGFDAGAQPMEELTQAREAFRHSMLQRETNQASHQDFQNQMEERRLALTSLRAYKHKHVGSLRTGIAVKHDNPGICKQDIPSNSLKPLRVYEGSDEQAAALPHNVSVIRSIIDSTKKKENVHEPGPWTKDNVSKKGGLFGKAGASSHLNFAIMEDDVLPPIPCPQKLYELGVQLPPNFVSRNLPQKPWNIPMVVEEPLVPKAIPMYEKFLLYPNTYTEISPDEYRGYKWFKDRGMKSPLTEQYDYIWENKYETEIRIPPGFPKCSVKQIEKESFEKFIATDETDGFQVPLDQIYPKNGDEHSPEELLAEKFKQGLIHVLTEEDFESFRDDQEMELTVIGDRRQSIYQMTRLSVIPRKSVMRKSFMPPPSVEEESEDDQMDEEDKCTSEKPTCSTSNKRKLEETEEGKAVDDKLVSALKKGSVADTPPRSNFNIFKQPTPVEKNHVYFSMNDDDDVCSTQHFNLFIKEQFVSTPVSKKVLHKQSLLTVETTEVLTKPVSPHANQMVSARSPENRNENFGPKQLSTIMETTESTQSTKSSVGQASTSNETDFNPKASEDPTAFKKERLFDPLATSFRMLEEPTETCPNMITRAVRMNQVFAPILTPMKAPLKPPHEIPQVVLSPPQPIFSEISVKSPEHEVTTIEVHDSEPELNASSSYEFNPNAQKLGSPASQDVGLPATHDFDLPATQSFDLPATQNVKFFGRNEIASPLQVASVLDDPELPQDAFIPAFQFESIPVPASQSLELPPGDFSLATEDIQIPATKEFEMPVLDDKQDFCGHEEVILDVSPTQGVFIPAIQDESILDIPAVQSFKRPTEHFEIPAIEDIDIPATEDIDIPATQEKPIAEALPTKKLTQQNDQFMFSIYEDTTKDIQVPLVSVPATFTSEDDGTKFFHMSHKENVLEQLEELEGSPKRTVSDEFLELLSTPKPKYQYKSLMSESIKVEKQREMSDLMKFSTPATLESSMRNLSVDVPKSATPTATTRIMFDEDLNTEKFSMALSNNKNSTLLFIDSKQAATLDLDLSIPMSENEMQRLRQELIAAENAETENVEEVNFKVPLLPATKPQKPTAAFKIFEDSISQEDLGKSIYGPKNIPEDDDCLDDCDDYCSFISHEENRYEHEILVDHGNTTHDIDTAIEASNGNPFDSRLHDALLESCKFSQYLEQHMSKSCLMLKNIPKLKPGAKVECNESEFTVLKYITKGTFGSIYTAKDSKDGKVVAMKQEKPPNLWEYYICVELIGRIKDTRMQPAFMTINKAIIAHNYSVLISDFSPYGSIIDVCNNHMNATNKHVDEYVVMVLATQLLSIVDHLHSCRIIHADLKPDNFLLMSKIEFGMKIPAIQLIDFGSAIDMDWYTNGETFNYVVSTENFVCCEMLENKPWTYQTDLFGLAGTVHVMLFGQYMQVEKKVLTWGIKTRFPRYFNKNIWEQFFRTLLNVQSCETMPNLQALKDQIEEIIQSKEKFVYEKLADFNKTLIN